MVTIVKTLGSALAATLIAGTGAAFAKGHDQGVADGFQPFPNTGFNIQTRDNGLSLPQIDGQRGDIQSAAKGDTRVEPVVGNGANSASN